MVHATKPILNELNITNFGITSRSNHCHTDAEWQKIIELAAQTDCVLCTSNTVFCVKNMGSQLKLGSELRATFDTLRLTVAPNELGRGGASEN